RLGPKLNAVVTMTADLALEQARQATKEIARGRARGRLHGVPYGAKDLLATKGIKTTWGSRAYATQVPAEDATVIRRLRLAGAVPWRFRGRGISLGPRRARPRIARSSSRPSRARTRKTRRAREAALSRPGT